MSTKVITGKVRLSYVHLFEPTAITEEDKPKYSVMLLIPKSDTKTIKALRAAEKAAELAGKAKWGSKKPKYNSVIKDGDDDEHEDWPERHGHWLMNVRSVSKPGVVDQDVQPILDASEVYSGCYARASVTAFAYTAGKGGVSFGLNHIQKLADGESLGGGSRAEEDFDAVESDDDDDDLI